MSDKDVNENTANNVDRKAIDLLAVCSGQYIPNGYTVVLTGLTLPHHHVWDSLIVGYRPVHDNEIGLRINKFLSVVKER